MTKINLLPHRELKRKARRRDFGIMAFVVAAIGAAIVFAAGFVIQQYIDVQKAKNDHIQVQSKKLDEEIKEIAKLREEIEALKARQKAVEDLQADRNLPVHVLDELVKQTPEGIYLRNIKQTGMRVVVSGQAMNNARVADYVRNLSNNSPWLVAPDLVEIRAVTTGTGSSARKLNDFSLGVNIQRQKAPEPKPAAAAGAAPPAAAAPPKKS